MPRPQEIIPHGGYDEIYPSNRNYLDYNFTIQVSLPSGTSHANTLTLGGAWDRNVMRLVLIDDPNRNYHIVFALWKQGLLFTKNGRQHTFGIYGSDVLIL